MKSTEDIRYWSVGPKHLPQNWRPIEAFGPDGWSYVSRDKLLVVQSLGEYEDDKTWLHTSFSRKNRTPDYGDMVEVKRVFVGKDRKAIMVLPASSEHVNIHPNCFHFFTPLSDDPLPDFTMGSGMI